MLREEYAGRLHCGEHPVRSFFPRHGLVALTLRHSSRSTARSAIVRTSCEANASLCTRLASSAPRTVNSMSVPLLLLQALERSTQRNLLDLEDAVGVRAEVLRSTVGLHRLHGLRVHDAQVERALVPILSFAGAWTNGHACGKR
jgi:hypothetical protein